MNESSDAYDFITLLFVATKRYETKRKKIMRVVCSVMFTLHYVHTLTQAAVKTTIQKKKEEMMKVDEEL